MWKIIVHVIQTNRQPVTAVAATVVVVTYHVPVLLFQTGNKYNRYTNRLKS